MNIWLNYCFEIKVVFYGCLKLKPRFGILFLLLMLAACSNQQAPVSSPNEKFVLVEDIKPYLEQWDNSKEKIASLSDMEEDLLLLIQALSAQTDIDAVPEPLKGDVKQIKYGSENKASLSAESTESKSIIDSKKISYTIQIARYMSAKRAEAQVQRLQEQYPQLSTILHYQINAQTKNSVTLYNLVAGPVETQKQAAQLCMFFSRLGNKCKLATFKEG